MLAPSATVFIEPPALKRISPACDCKQYRYNRTGLRAGSLGMPPAWKCDLGKPILTVLFTEERKKAN